MFQSAAVTTFTMCVHLGSVSARNSSLEGAMKLKFVSFYSS